MSVLFHNNVNGNSLHAYALHDNFEIIEFFELQSLGIMPWEELYTKGMHNYILSLEYWRNSFVVNPGNSICTLAQH